MLRTATSPSGEPGQGGVGLAGREFDAVVLELSAFSWSGPNISSCALHRRANLASPQLARQLQCAYVAAKAKILSLRAPSGWGIVQGSRRGGPEGRRGGAKRHHSELEERPKHGMAGHIFMGEEEVTLRLNGEMTRFSATRRPRSGGPQPGERGHERGRPPPPRPG